MTVWMLYLACERRRGWWIRMVEDGLFDCRSDPARTPPDGGWAEACCRCLTDPRTVMNTCHLKRPRSEETSESSASIAQPCLPVPGCVTTTFYNPVDSQDKHQSKHVLFLFYVRYHFKYIKKSVIEKKKTFIQNVRACEILFLYILIFLK